MRNISIASIGDCCVDIYPEQKKWFLGGTAFNVAVQVRRAGVQASLVSAVGDDTFGTLYYRQCTKLGIHTDLLKTIPGKTSSVEIPLDNEGNPMFSAWELGVLPELVLGTQEQFFLQKHTAVRGILLKPLEGLFRSFCDIDLGRGTMHRAPTIKVGDFAGGSQYSIGKEEILEYIHGVDIIVRSVGANNHLPVQTAEMQFLRDLAKRYNKIVLGLLGKEGSIVFTKDKEYNQPAIKTKVTDTTGAGDAYIAYFLVEYLTSRNIQLAMEKATKATSQIITQWGATNFQNTRKTQ